MLDLSGKVAIVTGAGRELGQGAATAAVLAQRGASVVLADIDLDAAQQRAKEIEEVGGRVAATHVDVREEDSVIELIKTAVDEFGGLHILHNQAFDTTLIGDPGDPEITQSSVDQYHAIFSPIAWGAILGCKHGIPAMVASGGGSIVCTSSVSSMVGELNLTLYGAAKASVNQLVRSVSTQWGKEGIRCNAVAPGLILSQAGLSIGQEAIDTYARHSDTVEVGQPIDVAHLVAFLASDEARYITGQVIAIDGGMTQHSPIVTEQRVSGAIAGMTSE